MDIGSRGATPPNSSPRNFREWNAEWWFLRERREVVSVSD
ncbi:unnamed protein product, partial [Lasius platythorax]